MKNAIAYSYEGSTIAIEARRQDDGGVRIRFINQVIRFRRLSSR